MNIKKSALTIFVSFLALTFAIHSGDAMAAERSAGQSIVVKDFIFKSGGRGVPAVLNEITLMNTSVKEFENIEVEIELYSRNNTPQGSLRTTIRERLAPGSEQTFRNISLGMMHSDIDRTTARVVRAQEIETGTPSHPRHLLLVTNWEFSGSQYGTEGILKELTIENRSREHFRNIRLKFSNLGIGGPKVGPEGYTNYFTIGDFIEAGTSKTFQNVNVGFRHPGAMRHNIYVVDASRMSQKELRYLIAEKEGKPAGAARLDTEPFRVEEADEVEQRPSLAERYRQRTGRERAEEVQTELPETDETTIAQETTSEEVTEPVKTVKEQPPRQQTDEEKAVPDSTAKERELAAISEQEVAIPRHDIVVRSFRWGSGVPGTQGTIRSLVLENISGIDYSRIELVVEFFSNTGVRLGSNDLRINELLRAGETITLENLSVGIIQVLPDERNIKIRVRNARPVR